jgi:hypothetical protein
MTGRDLNSRIIVRAFPLGASSTSNKVSRISGTSGSDIFPLTSSPTGAHILISCFPDLKFNCTDQDGPVRFRAAFKIFATRYLFNGLPVGSEHFHFVFSVSAKMIVQSILADPAADALLAVLPPENNNFTIVDVPLLRRWKRQ